MRRLKCIVIAVLTYLFSSVALKADDYAKAFEALGKGDYEMAAYYLSFFGSNGDSVAQYNMGILYRDGLGVENDHHWCVLLGGIVSNALLFGAIIVSLIGRVR